MSEAPGVLFSDAEAPALHVPTKTLVTASPLFPPEILEAYPGLSYEFEWVTPETAGRYLDTIVEKDDKGRAGQRPLDSGDAAFWAKKIIDGRFKFVPDPIMFDENGAMYNGQHRCRGLQVAREMGWEGKHLPFMVGRNWPRELFLVIDHQQKRTVSQTLAIHNETMTARLAATLRMVYCYLHVQDQKQWGKVKLPDEQIVELLEAHPDVRKSVALSRETTSLKLNPVAVAFTHYIFGLVGGSREGADAWFSQLIVGNNLRVLEPIHSLRKFMLEGDDRRVSEAVRGVSKQKLHTYYLYRAWNNTMTGTQMKNPVWKDPGLIRDIEPYVIPGLRPRTGVMED